MSSCKIYHKEYVIVPEDNFVLGQNVLKTNGYYYCEITRSSHCKKEIADYGGELVDESSKYEAKGVTFFSLFNDGYLYTSGGFMYRGFYVTDDVRLDYCHLLEESNNFKSARFRLEEALRNGVYSSSLDVKRRGVSNRGIFSIEDKTIILQYYYAAEGGSELVEKKGEILNDTTFLLTSQIYFKNKSRKEINERYHFKHFPIKPDSISYIREYKHKFGKK